MAKLDKEYKARMDGMIYAYKVAEEKGVEALKKEIMTRGFFKLDISMPMDYAEKVHSFIGTNIYNTVLSTVLYVLKRHKGYGTKRLQDFKALYDKEAMHLIDLNWHGEHFVTLEQRALELNRDHGFEFDLARLSVLQKEDDSTNPHIKKLDFEGTCQDLEHGGFPEAAEFLRMHVMWLRGEISDEKYTEYNEARKRTSGKRTKNKKQ